MEGFSVVNDNFIAKPVQKFSREAAGVRIMIFGGPKSRGPEEPEEPCEI